MKTPFSCSRRLRRSVLGRARVRMDLRRVGTNREGFWARSAECTNEMQIKFSPCTAESSALFLVLDDVAISIRLVPDMDEICLAPAFLASFQLLRENGEKRWRRYRREANLYELKRGHLFRSPNRSSTKSAS